ncbi:MAG: phosphatase PAP2 family protein [Rhizomicrobium sp.]
MMIVRRFALAIVLACALAAPAAAASFLTAGQIDAGLLLPPPPANDSPREAEEIAELRAIAAHRTPAEWDAATADAKDSTGDWFASAIGPDFDFARLPATQHLLADIGDTEEGVATTAKTYFHRDRPWIVAPDIKTCTPVKPGPAPTSYPSGHATIAYAMGVTLARLMPDKAQAILARAALYAERRLVCGMHFRSDIVGGQALGTVLALELQKNPDFRKEYDAAAAELAAAHLRSVP